MDKMKVIIRNEFGLVPSWFASAFNKIDNCNTVLYLNTFKVGVIKITMQPTWIVRGVANRF